MMFFRIEQCYRNFNIFCNGGPRRQAQAVRTAVVKQSQVTREWKLESLKGLLVDVEHKMSAEEFLENVAKGASESVKQAHTTAAKAVEDAKRCAECFKDFADPDSPPDTNADVAEGWLSSARGMTIKWGAYTLLAKPMDDKIVGCLKTLYDNHMKNAPDNCVPQALRDAVLKTFSDAGAEPAQKRRKTAAATEAAAAPAAAGKRKRG